MRKQKSDNTSDNMRKIKLGINTKESVKIEVSKDFQDMSNKVSNNNKAPSNTTLKHKADHKASNHHQKEKNLDAVYDLDTVEIDDKHSGNKGNDGNLHKTTSSKSNKGNNNVVGKSHNSKDDLSPHIDKIEKTEKVGDTNTSAKATGQSTSISSSSAVSVSGISEVHEDKAQKTTESASKVDSRGVVHTDADNVADNTKIKPHEAKDKKLSGNFMTMTAAHDKANPKIIAETSDSTNVEDVSVNNMPKRKNNKNMRKKSVLMKIVLLPFWIVISPFLLTYKFFSGLVGVFTSLFSGTNIAPVPIAVGVVTILTFFGLFGFWSFTAPIDSAAVASGSVVVDSRKKIVQHLEGGIIKNILIKDGDYVIKNQVLIELDGTNAAVNQSLLTKNTAILELSRQRLISERDGKDEIEFDNKIFANFSEIEKQEVISNEKKIFQTRRKDFVGRISLLEQKSQQFSDQINGLEAQKQSALSQLQLINEEIESVELLLQDGSATKPRLLSLQRKAAELRGFVGEYTASISRVKEAIIENNIQITNLQNEYQRDIFMELKEVNSKISNLQEKNIGTSDVLNRIAIRSPESGIVNGLKYHSAGAVIGPGETIMEIVPQNDKLVIEAKISVQDIDVVHIGLPAKVRITAYRSRQTPLLKGKVTYISPDKVISKDPVTKDHYLANIEVSSEEVNILDDAVELYPGMPADVFIVTGSRTLIQYIMSPITDSFYKSFRED